MTYLFAGLAALLAFVALRIGKQIWYTYQCPGDPALYDFWYGRMDKKSQAHRNVVTHLGHCERCRETLYRIQKGQPLEDHLVD